MTYDLDRTTPELEAELRNANLAERSQIKVELDFARVERQAIWAKQDGCADGVPPFYDRYGAPRAPFPIYQLEPYPSLRFRVYVG